MCVLHYHTSLKIFTDSSVRLAGQRHHFLFSMYSSTGLKSRTLCLCVPEFIFSKLKKMADFIVCQIVQHQKNVAINDKVLELRLK